MLPKEQNQIRIAKDRSTKKANLEVSFLQHREEQRLDMEEQTEKAQAGKYFAT